MKEIAENTKDYMNSETGMRSIGFLDSFSADTSIVPHIINRLIIDLNGMKYHQEEIDEIIISMDESVTNAIQETIHKNMDITDNPDRRDITVRYTISEHEFNATIIDHGKGLDLFNILKNVPCCDSKTARRRGANRSLYRRITSWVSSLLLLSTIRIS